MHTIRLLSYNIHKGIGGRDRRYRLERVVEVIEEEKPDIVCLQEVDRHVKRSHFDDQPKLLGQQLNLEHSLYQPNVTLKHGGYGNLILSRWSFAEHHHISLRLKKKKPRGAQLAIIKTSLGHLSVVNFHLGLAESERIWQINHLLQHHLFHQINHLPLVIIGDTNDWRNRLHKNCLLPKDYQHVTTPIFKFRTFPAWMPLGSLDKCYVKNGIHPKRVKVARSKLGKQSSDHLPIVLDIHF